MLQGAKQGEAVAILPAGTDEVSVDDELPAHRRAGPGDTRRMTNLAIPPERFFEAWPGTSRVDGRPAVPDTDERACPSENRRVATRLPGKRQGPFQPIPLGVLRRPGEGPENIERTDQQQRPGAVTPVEGPEHGRVEIGPLFPERTPPVCCNAAAAPLLSRLLGQRQEVVEMPPVQRVT